jgi:hypothetical protein
MTKHHDLFAALAAPFDPDEVKVRSQAGRQLPYVTARTIMNRLDDVLGPENWWDEFVPLEHSVICRLTIRLPDGAVLTKSDAGGYAGMADPGDDEKSGFADAFKRTAVKFGVGRYLYRDGVPKFVREHLQHRRDLQPQDAPPARASDAPGPQSAPARAASVRARAPEASELEPGSSPPKTGRALFAWTKEQDQRYQYGLLKHLTDWAGRQDFPARMVDWDSEQVGKAYSEAFRKVRSLRAKQQGSEPARAD